MSTDSTPKATCPAVATNRICLSFKTGPHAWRLARKNGELILQCLMVQYDNNDIDKYWETIPTIDLTDEESES